MKRERISKKYEIEMLYEQLKLKNNMVKSYQADLERLQEQIKEANRLIKWCMRLGWSGNQEEDDFDRYCEKWGVE